MKKEYIAGENIRLGDILMINPSNSNEVIKYNKKHKLKNDEYIQFAGVVVMHNLEIIEKGWPIFVETKIPSTSFRDPLNNAIYLGVYFPRVEGYVYKRNDYVMLNEDNQLIPAYNELLSEMYIGRVSNSKYNSEKGVNGTNLIVIEIDTEKYKGWSSEYFKKILKNKLNSIEENK